MTNPLSGLAAVVTGSASGIGLATARMLHSRGVEVFGLDIQRGELNGGMSWLECDVTKPDSINKAFASIETESDRLDIVVNCAGIGAIGSIEDATEDEWMRVYDTNVVGTARIAARHYRFSARAQARRSSISVPLQRLSVCPTARCIPQVKEQSCR